MVGDHPDWCQAGIPLGCAGEQRRFLLAPPYLVVLQSLRGHVDWRVALAYTVLAVSTADLGARLVIRASPGGWPRLRLVLVLLAWGVLLPGR